MADYCSHVCGKAEARIAALRKALGKVAADCKNFKCGRDGPCGSCQLARQALAADDGAEADGVVPSDMEKAEAMGYSGDGGQ